MSLIIIGVLSYYSGVVAEKIKLPSLIGMIILGMFIGPSFLNIVPSNTLELSYIIKDTALVIILLIGGLGISVKQIKQIGRPAILLSIIPATFEGFGIALLSMKFLSFSFIQGAILGFIIAAVSPAILVPSMTNLINKNIGQDKAIPQMLLVGASADDTVAITLFTTFLTIYFQNIDSNGYNSSSLIFQILLIPISIVISILVSIIAFKITNIIMHKLNNIYFKIIIILFIALAMRYFETFTHTKYFNSLLAVMVYGFLIRNFNNSENINFITNKINGIWKYGKLYLFCFVGMAINPTLVGKYFYTGIKILTISLLIRAFGVYLSLIKTNLTIKEKLFCIIAYIPKATVQSAKASIPLQMGVANGEIMQAISILSVLITAPIGAIGIKITSKKFLNNANYPI